MKHLSKIVGIFIILITGVISSCSTNEKGDDSENNVNNENDSLVVEMKYAELVELDQKLVKTDMTIDKTIAQQLYNKSKDFVLNNADNNHLEAVMEFQAKAAEGLGKKNEAIEILHDMMHKFGTSDKVIIYMYNKARILESMSGKQNNARAAYEEMILKFPDEQLSRDTRVYLDTYFGKSEDEIIKMLKEQNPE